MEEQDRDQTRFAHTYLSYLVRMWSVSVEGVGHVWRASVESPITQKQSHFQDLESLFTFLRSMSEQSTQGPGNHKNEG